MTSEYYINGPKILLHIVSHVHPDNKRDFRSAVTPKSVRKELKGNIMYVCVMCAAKQEEEAKLLMCSRCKNSWYCSKECQKKHWPTHKPFCQKADTPAKNLINNLIANPLLMLDIQTAIVLQCRLNEKPRPDSPLSVYCDLSIVPSDMTYWLRLTTGSIPAEELEGGTEGMLQVSGIVEMDVAATIDTTRMEMWRMTKDPLRAEGRHNEHVAIIYFQLPNAPQGIAISVMIPQLVIELADSDEGYERKSAIFGSCNIPLSVESCLEFINTHIRSDKRNQLRLRLHMTKDDIDKSIEKLCSKTKDV